MFIQGARLIPESRVFLRIHLVWPQDHLTTRNWTTDLWPLQGSVKLNALSRIVRHFFFLKFSLYVQLSTVQWRKKNITSYHQNFLMILKFFWLFLTNFWQFLKKFFQNIFFTFNLLTVASFEIGVPSILFWMIFCIIFCIFFTFWTNIFRFSIPCTLCNIWCHILTHTLAVHDAMHFSE